MNAGSATVLRVPEFGSYFVFKEDELRAFRDKLEALLYFLPPEPEPPAEHTEQSAIKEIDEQLEFEARNLEHNWVFRKTHGDNFEEAKVRLLEAKRRIYMRDVAEMVGRRNRESQESHELRLAQRTRILAAIGAVKSRGSDKGTQSLAELLGEPGVVDGYWLDFLPLVAPVMMRKIEGELETLGEAAYWKERQGGEKTTGEEQDAYVEDREALKQVWADAQNDAGAVDADSRAILLGHLRETVLRD